jgi:hypothetical protein
VCAYDELTIESVEIHDAFEPRRQILEQIMRCRLTPQFGNITVNGGHTDKLSSHHFVVEASNERARVDQRMHRRLGCEQYISRSISGDERNKLVERNRATQCTAPVATSRSNDRADQRRFTRA